MHACSSITILKWFHNPACPIVTMYHGPILCMKPCQDPAGNRIQVSQTWPDALITELWSIVNPDDRSLFSQ